MSAAWLTILFHKLPSRHRTPSVTKGQALTHTTVGSYRLQAAQTGFTTFKVPLYRHFEGS